MSGLVAAFMLGITSPFLWKTVSGNVGFPVLAVDKRPVGGGGDLGAVTHLIRLAVQR